MDEFATELAAASKRNRKKKSLKKLQILGICITLAALWPKLCILKLVPDKKLGKTIAQVLFNLFKMKKGEC